MWHCNQSNKHIEGLTHTLLDVHNVVTHKCGLHKMQDRNACWGVTKPFSRWMSIILSKWIQKLYTYLSTHSKTKCDQFNIVDWSQTHWMLALPYASNLLTHLAYGHIIVSTQSHRILILSNHCQPIHSCGNGLKEDIFLPIFI
mgnify:FL=1